MGDVTCLICLIFDISSKIFCFRGEEGRRKMRDL